MLSKERYKEWRDANIVRCEFTLNRKKHADVIEMMSLQKSKQKYVIRLVREDIARKQEIINARKKETAE